MIESYNCRHIIIKCLWDTDENSASIECSECELKVLVADENLTEEHLRQEFNYHANGIREDAGNLISEFAIGTYRFSDKNDGFLPPLSEKIQTLV